MVSPINRLILVYLCFYLQLKIPHKENTQLRERLQCLRSANVVIFCSTLNRYSIIRRREAACCHITNGAKLLLLHQTRPNHLINTAAWKHQHMVGIKSTSWIDVQQERLYVNPSVFSSAFTGYICCCCCCCMASHYLSDKSAKWKCWESWG